MRLSHIVSGPGPAWEPATINGSPACLGRFGFGQKVTQSCWFSFLLVISFLPASHSCSSSKRPQFTGTWQDTAQQLEPPKGEVVPYKVHIEVHDDKCVLNYDGPLRGRVETELLAPCEFLRDPAGNIRSKELKNSPPNGGGSYTVIVLIGGPPANEGYSDKYMKSCASEAQTVSLSVRGIALGSKGWGMNLCPTSSFDDKLFTADSRPI